MRKLLFVLFAGAVLMTLAAPARAQKTLGQTKAWLDTHTDPAAINVHGVWHSNDWGTIVLNQPADSREVTGIGDEWEIAGVVSGTQVYLAFYSPERVGYSAVLSAQGDDTLAGVYNSGLKDGPRGKDIKLARTVKQAGGMDPKKWTDYMPQVPAGQAFVFVFRNNSRIGSILAPAVYCDDAQVASIQNGAYFIVKVAPGTHKFRSNDGDRTEVSVDVKAGEKYYVRVEIRGTFKGSGVAVASTADEGDRAVHVLMPIDKSNIKDTAKVLVPGFDKTGTN